MDRDTTQVETNERWNAVISICLENSEFLPDDASEDCKRAEKKSQYMLFLRDFLEVARAQSETKGQGPDHPEASDRIERAIFTAKSVLIAYQGLPFGMEEKKNLDAEEISQKLSVVYPAGALDMIETVKDKGPLHATADFFEAGIMDYMESEFRDRTIDRTLLIALTDLEITTFVSEMNRKDLFSGKSRVEMVNININRVWVNGRLISFSTWIALVGAVFLSAKIWPETVPVWTGFAALSIALILFIVGSTVTLISLPGAKRKLEEASEPVLGIIDRMDSFYREFRSPGPISIVYFRSRLEALRKSGVVWPVSIWALLDDIEARGLIFV